MAKRRRKRRTEERPGDKYIKKACKGLRRRETSDRRALPAVPPPLSKEPLSWAGKKEKAVDAPWHPMVQYSPSEGSGGQGERGEGEKTSRVRQQYLPPFPKTNDSSMLPPLLQPGPPASLDQQEAPPLYRGPPAAPGETVQVREAPPVQEPPQVTEAPTVAAKAAGEEPARGEFEQVPTALLCPLHGNPCLHIYCMWFDDEHTCSLLAMKKAQEESLLRLKSLYDFLEYVAKRLELP